jgi:hypothetical protein
MNQDLLVLKINTVYRYTSFSFQPMLKAGFCLILWRNRTIFRDIRTQGNCGPRQKLGAAGEMVTLRARLARRKGTFIMKDLTRNQVEQEVPKEQTPEKRLWKDPKGINDISDRGMRQQLLKKPGGRWPRYLMKRGTRATDGVRGWSSQRPSHVEGGGTLYETQYETVGMKIAKQMAGSSARKRSIKDWTLWRGRPPPKRLKS